VARYPALAAAALLCAALVFGAVRIRQVDETVAHTPRLKVGLVQPNFAYTIDGEFSRDEALRQLTALQEQSRLLEQQGAQLVVWSEGSFPIAVPRDFSADFSPDSLALIRRGFTVPTMIGAEMYDAAREDAFNSALLLDGNGKVTGRYDKVRLLAFGEYVPGIETFPWLRKFLPAGAGRFTAGAGPGMIPMQDPSGREWRLGPVICYEDILQNFLRGVGQLHPNLLVNLTSDSWFGADTEPWEHMALSVFASVELRVSMVRSVNSGISTLIDPVGRVAQKTYANDPYRHPRSADSLLVEAPYMAGGQTLFVRVGNLFAYLCLAASLIFLGAAWRRARRENPVIDAGVAAQ
jgi:apolipoprotein N-acyltransferase